MRSRRSVLAILFAGALAIAAAAFFGRGTQTPVSNERAAATIQTQQCGACHPAIHRDYQHVGMARSFAAGSKTSSPEHDRATTFFHERSGRYYEAKFRGANLVQRRYERDAAGREINSFELEATHTIGSGNHARSYLHRSASGEIIQLPLTWYTQENAWAMSPGYDTARPPDFTRIVDDSCLFCHNGYPREGRLAEGIDCERCHGPASKHIELASSKRPVDQIRSAIVNPKRLPPERQMDVCMQCHLETTSAELPQMLRRFDRTPFSYTAGQPLGDYMIHFDHAGKHAGKFEIVNQAYRLRQSACYVQSQGKMTCSTCHDPHSVPRGVKAVAYYRAKCVQCHATVQAAATHPALSTADCASCHMPKRRTEDAVHVVMTDHLIQRAPLTRNPLAARPEQAFSYRGPIAVYYPTNLPPRDHSIYLGVASISGSSDVQRGTKMLEDAAASGPLPAKAIAVLAEGYLARGDTASAIEAFRKALAADPSLAKAQYNLGRALEQANQPGAARAAFESAIAIKPAFPEAEYALANLSAQTGDRTKAATHYSNALRLRPTYAEAHGNLGNLHAAEGRVQDAIASLEQAIRIDPGYADAYSNLARTLAAVNRLPDAIAHCKRALALDPAHPQARYNLARLLHETGATEAAFAEYRKLIEIAPRMAEAHLGYGQALGDVGRLLAAIEQFREVLRLQPGHAEAQRNLALALEMQAQPKSR